MTVEDKIPTIHLAALFDSKIGDRLSDKYRCCFNMRKSCKKVRFVIVNGYNAVYYLKSITSALGKSLALKLNSLSGKSLALKFETKIFVHSLPCRILIKLGV